MRAFMLCATLGLPFLPAEQLNAATIIDTASVWDSSNSVGTLGEGSTDTYGQTFTVPSTDVILNSFSFWLDDRLNPAPIDFAAYVMEWVDSVGIASPAHATGPILYESTMYTSTNNSGSDGMEQFTFDTGGITLQAGKKYVAFLSSSLFWDGVNSGAEIGALTLGNDGYSGGEFVLQATGNNFDPLVTQGGWNVANQDLAFTAELSAVPLPPAFYLLGSGLIGLLGFARVKMITGASTRNAALQPCGSPSAGRACYV